MKGVIVMSEKLNSFIIHELNIKATKDINGLQAEQEHALDHAEPGNRNYDPERSSENIIIYHNPDFPYMGKNQDELERERLEKNPDCKYTREWNTQDIIKDKLQTMKDEKELKGRCSFRNDERGSIVYQSYLLGMSKELHDSLTPQERIDHLKDGARFLQETMKGKEWIDIRIHQDEQGQVHLQAKCIPLHEEPDGRKTLSTKAHDRDQVIRDYKEREQEPPKDKSGNIATKFSYTSLQNNYFRFCSEKLRERDYEKELTRTHKTRERQEDREYKALQEEKKQLEREIEKLNKEIKDREERKRELEAKEKRIDDREKQLDKTIESVNKQIKAIDKSQNEREKELDKREEKTIERGEKAEKTLHDKTTELKFMHTPEPAGKGLHKGFFTQEQVEKIIGNINNYINTLRETGRDILEFREMEIQRTREEKHEIERSREIYKKSYEKSQEQNKELKRENEKSNRIIDKLKSIPFLRDNVFKAEKQVERD
ncbi:MAG: hypothetical protein UD103_00335, partial [Bacteroidales bacterium]|nr:hypothetical protein [Bacteroidales bacterium]